MARPAATADQAPIRGRAQTLAAVTGQEVPALILARPSSDLWGSRPVPAVPRSRGLPRLLPQEVGAAADHALLLRRGQLGEHGQRQHRAGGGLAGGEVARLVA